MHSIMKHKSTKPVKLSAANKTKFWSKVSKSQKCWLWVGPYSSGGYGFFYHGHGIKELAHRLSWRIKNGPIKQGLCICHRCDVPACVRPGHLFAGTQAENIRDASRKGRLVGKPHAIKLSAADILAISRSGLPAAALAIKYALSTEYVGAIRRNVIRKDVPRKAKYVR